ncbi:uncharacterized protein LOC131946153 [Physella acuta]|uniref:uncharacterized protein LOC131946153 n=1 Tax=Physella acuta TaxID=109671 RepID=UPI0027DE574D|nr:uncharacterized protein LOC131946153 [Physella acuta]
MAPTHFLRMINILALVCLGLISKVEGQASHMGVEFQVQFPYMPEGQPILMMNSPMLDTFDVYVTAPLSDHPVSERISRSDTTTSIVAKGKFYFGMTVFMPVSVHSAASFQAIPTSGFGAEYYVLAPKMGPWIVLMSLVEENEISVRFTEPMEQLESKFTEGLLSTIALNRKEAYIMQNCTGRTVGEKHLGAITPAKITALYSFGVIVGTCEEYEFESKCQRKNVKTAGGVTAEMLIPSRTGEKQFVIPVTINEETQVINVAVGRVLEKCKGSITRINDGLETDCDGFVDEEREIMKDGWLNKWRDPELFEQHTSPLREEKEKREQENNCQQTCCPSVICLSSTTIVIGLILYVTLMFCVGISIEFLRRRRNASLAELMSVEADIVKLRALLKTAQREHMSEDQAQ